MRNYQKALEIERNRISNNTDESIFGSFYFPASASGEERLSIYDETVYDICMTYLSLSKSSIDVLPTTTLELLDMILSEAMFDNPYRESFLLSLQFIYQEYFEALGKGSPTLMSSFEKDKQPSLEITLDSRNQITQFDSTNMDSLEQTKTMTKILSLERERKLGPIPNVTFQIRRDF